MGQDGKGKERRKKRHEHEHEHKYEAEQEKARGDRPAGGHRNGNHTSLWTTATDLPAGGYHMAWRMLGYTNGCQCRHIHHSPTMVMTISMQVYFALLASRPS